ncbi:MAG: gamma-glutamyltransferase [Streptosporangiaceae bacterium]
MGRGGAVAAAHPLAALAGLDILRGGGNAMDAAVATNAVLSVTQPHMCGVGGDFFCLIYSRETGQVSFLNASGRSPVAATRAEITRRGHGQVPFRGPLSVTVPGCVDGWRRAWERFGRAPWASLFDPAVEYAARGYPASHGLARCVGENEEALKESTYLRSTFLPQRRPIVPGALLVQPELATTFQLIASEGREGLYTGRIAERVSTTMRDTGGLLAFDDLVRHRSDWDNPIATAYRGHRIHTTGANSQGVTALIALNVLEGEDLGRGGPESPERVHRSVEAIKLAFKERRRITDPDFVPCPSEELLSKEFAASLRARIEPKAAPLAPEADPRGDTTYFAVVDAEGNAVSGIQSLYGPFGSCVVPEETGIILQNRGAYFSLEPAHPNALEPGKRTFHTLMASIVTREDRPVLIFGTMGAAGQPQTNVQVITNVLDYGMNIQEAIEAPRWLQGNLYVGEPETALYLEDRFDPGLVRDLRQRGHDVHVLDGWPDHMGHAQGIVIDPDTGVLTGGADPRGDGYALAC